jgi:concanavalin A-like lectin/glucanase superfamily protein
LSCVRTPIVPALALACAAVATVAAFQGGNSGPASLGAALTFHASFDTTADADFALGDKRIYTAASYKTLDAAQAGIQNPAVALLPGKGRHGGALEFKAKNTTAIYYQAAKNVDYRDRDWSGTVSFWLSLDPDQDLTGYTDPIQITDKDYNNSALWVDFTNQVPRPVRLGVFPDLAAWNPDKLTGQTNPAFLRHIVAVQTPPFGRGKWTHVAFTFAGLNGQQPGAAKFYLNGALQGTAGSIPETFTLDPARTTIRLGVSYAGLYDDLSIFNRALSDSEIQSLYALPAGVSSLHR